MDFSGRLLWVSLSLTFFLSSCVVHFVMMLFWNRATSEKLLVHEQQHTVAKQQLLLILSLQHRQIHKAFWSHKEAHASQPIASYTRKEDI